MNASISFAPLDAEAIAFLMRRTGIDYGNCRFDGPSWFCCAARDHGTILGVFIGEFMNAFDCHISCAIDHPRFLTRRLLRAIFTALYSRAVRITAMTRPDNERALRIIKHLGFQVEGYSRLAIEGRWDALVFSMLRDECRFIQQPSSLGYIEAISNIKVLGGSIG
jgi:ribosomal protein S18 acetylase RimI-like enzyme